MLPFVRYMLVAMCANFQSSFVADDQNFTCILKSEEQIRREVYKGKTIRILTFDEMPLSGARKDGKGGVIGEGVAFELVETLRDKFGFQYTVEKITPAIVGDESHGALGKLASKEVDMVAAFIPVLPDSHEYMTFGTDLSQAKYYVMLKRPGDSTSGSGLLAPFDEVVWILILFSVAIVGPIFYGVMWLRRRLCPLDIDQLYPLSTCVWFVYGALMKQGSTLNPIADSARMVFATWWIFILILTAFYTANLTAFLTLSISILPIKEIDDVTKDSRHWFTLKGGPVEHAIKDQEDETLRKLRYSALRGQGTFLENKQESTIFQRVLNDWYYLDNSYTLTRMMYDDYKKKSEQGVEGDLRCAFVLTEKPFLVRSLAFAYQKDSPLPDLFNPVLERFIESGILQHKLNLDLPDATICPKDLDNKERKLRNSDLTMTYIVVMVGISLASVILLCEVIWFFYKKRIKEPKLLQGKLNKQQMFQSRLNGDKLLAMKDQVQAKINGRDYFIVTNTSGFKQFIPQRTPSALLFNYD